MNGYFNSIFNPGAASPSAFTSPGMNPQALQQLLAMQGGVNSPPMNMGNPIQMTGGMGNQSQNPLGDARMAQIQQMLQKMGGAGIAPGMTMMPQASPQSAMQPGGQMPMQMPQAPQMPMNMQGLMR